MKKTFYIILFFSFFALLPTISHGAITTSSLTHNSAIIKVSDVFANKKITIELYQNKALIDKKTVTANNEGSASVYYPNLKSNTKYDMKVETSTGVISTYSFTTTIEVPEVTLTISNITSNSVKVEAKGFKEASGTTRDMEVSNTDDATQHYYKKQENPPESNGILAATFTDLKPNGNYVANAVRRSKTEFEILNSANFTTTSDTSEKKAPEYWSYYANENKDLSNKVFSTQDLCQEASSNRLGADKNVFYEWQNCFLSDSNGTPIIGDAIPVTPKEKNTPSWSEYKLLAPFAGFDKAPENVGDYLNKIFIIGIGLCGALAVLMMILAGIQYMGEESIFEKSKWRERFKSAIFGLLIALSAYALLNTIDPRLLGGEGLSIRAVTAEIDTETETTPWSEYSSSGSKILCPEGFVDVIAPGTPSSINVCKSIATDLTKLLEKAKTDGVKLGGFGSRSTAQQKSLRIKHGCPDDNTPSNQCKPETARPGYSMHESGKAIDFRCDGAPINNKENTCFKWLSKNAGPLLKNLKSGKEPWHWSTTGN